MAIRCILTFILKKVNKIAMEIAIIPAKKNWYITGTNGKKLLFLRKKISTRSMVNNGILRCDTSLIMIESINLIEIKKYNKVTGIKSVKTTICIRNKYISLLLK